MMKEEKKNYGVIIGLAAALLALVGVIALMAKVIRDFSAKLNTTDGDIYIPDWSDEDSFDMDLSEELSGPDDQ